MKSMRLIVFLSMSVQWWLGFRKFDIVTSRSFSWSKLLMRRNERMSKKGAETDKEIRKKENVDEEERQR